MAHSTIFFEHPTSRKRRDAPVGFSWTTLFFGPLPLLFRGAWKWLVISLVCGLFTYGLSNLVLMFMINGEYIKDLERDGYKAMS